MMHDIPDFVRLRIGTNTLTALKKIMGVSKEYLLSESKSLKLQSNIVMELRVVHEKKW